MQRSSAPARRNRWLRWGRVFFFGVLLGLLQLGLLFQGDKLEQWATTSWPVIVAISALLYVLIPALEGFLASWQSEDATSGIDAGCLVGGMCLLVLAVGITLGAILTPHHCQSGPGVTCGIGFSAELLSGTALAIGISFYIAEGLGSLVGGYLGGWIGGFLGQRLASRAHWSSARAAQEPSPEELPG
jgi:hypothetical protein